MMLASSTKSRDAAAVASELCDALERAAAAVDQAKGELPRLEAARGELDPAACGDGACGALEESEFQLKVYAARADTAVKSAHGLAGLLSGQVRTLREQNGALEAEAQALRERVARLEAGAPRGHGLDAVMATIRDRPPQPRRSSSLGEPTEASAKSSCCDCSTGPSGGGTTAHVSGCAHKELLATRVIDNTFDEYKRRLRQRLADAEAELARLRSGEALRAEVARREAAEERCRAMAKDFEAQRATWVKMIGVSSRIASGGDSGSATDTASSGSSTAPRACATCAVNRHNLVLSDRLQQHAALLACMREASSDMKAFVLADAVVAATRAQQRSKGASSASVRIPSPPSASAADPPPAKTQHLVTAAEAPPRRPLMAGSSTQRGRQPVEPPSPTAATGAADDGPSGVFRKPLHQRPAGGGARPFVN